MKSTDRLITIDEFIAMLGVSKWWFYQHADDPDVPQRLYVGHKQVPRLLLSECMAYIESLKEKRAPKSPPPPPMRKKIGRPRKIRLPLAGE